MSARVDRYLSRVSGLRWGLAVLVVAAVLWVILGIMWLLGVREMED